MRTVSPVPVREVVAADPAGAVVVLTRLPGTSLLDEPPPDPAALVDQRLAPASAGDLWQRSAFHARCALLEDLAFGLRTGDRRYVDAATAHLARAFGPP